MAIKHDASSSSAAAAGLLEWNHEPVGVPAAVLVLVVTNGTFGVVDHTGVTYGGKTMSQVPGSPVVHKTGAEDGGLLGFFLEAPPAGKQLVVVPSLGVLISRRAVCVSVTAAGLVEIADVRTLDAEAGANPSVALSSSEEAVAYGALHSGQDDPASIAPGAGMTELLEHDFGSQVAAWLRSTAASEKGFTLGWTAASEEAGVLAVALRENQPPAIIGGLEARHAWTPAGSSVPYVLGRITDDAGNPVWPHAKLKVVAGLESLGEAQDNRVPRIGGVGEIPLKSDERGKVVTYEGWLQARSLRSLREATAAMRRAFADRDQEGRMDVTWHPLNPDFVAEPAKFYEARVLGLEIVDSQDTKLYERRFLLALRMGDPRYFDEETEVSELAIAETNIELEFK